MEFSLLRLLGLILGISLLVVVFYHLRFPKQQRISLSFPVIMGIALMTLSLFPAIMNAPSQLLLLSDIPGGRLLTLLLITAVILIFTVLCLYSLLETYRLQLDALYRYTTVRDFLSATNDSLKDCATLVLIPAYNEADNLKLLLPTLPKQIDDMRLQVLVIDDGSQDDTAQVVKEANCWLAQHPINRGGGAALRTGFDIAAKTGAKIIITMDADGQHDPSNIERLIRPIMNDAADLVIGSRILGQHEEVSMVRTLGVNIFSRMISSLMGANITDCSSGFRAMRPALLDKLYLVQNQYHTAELIIEAIKQGTQVMEVPIEIKRRHSGESKKGRDLIYGLNFFITILRAWWR